MQHWREKCPEWLEDVKLFAKTFGSMEIEISNRLDPELLQKLKSMKK